MGGQNSQSQRERPSGYDIARGAAVPPPKGRDEPPANSVFEGFESQLCLFGCGTFFKVLNYAPNKHPENFYECSVRDGGRCTRIHPVSEADLTVSRVEKLIARVGNARVPRAIVNKLHDWLKAQPQ